ncbi:glycosyltransferase family 2 protein [Acidovorax sp. SRB_14]|uniref:glycosyltransferase family 2 protein n=1 Tax=Acidovorax sp. SRB_14 TaxID=1962699 RepID=UPI001565F962|nr:glycosyltransferase family 2 protein [Acidovorax sp. SRB_14]
MFDLPYVIPMNIKMNYPIVTVVLATYNGEFFLPEQLESLAAQSRRPDRLVLRDDGSTDRSVELVQAWADRNGVALQQVRGPRLGPARSFMKALQMAEPADIFLFCDQDDVWQPYKIERALNLVPWGDDVAPTLCATRLEIVDEQLNPLRLSFLPTDLSFSSAACESLLTGCTMAFNAAFRELLVHALPEHAPMHDWWCYLLATSANGAALHFDPTPTVLYRQHGGNALGAGPVGWSALRARGLRFFGRNSTMRSRQLQEFAKLHGSALTPEAAAILCQLLAAKRGLMPRLRAAFTTPIRRQTFLATLTTRLALLTNRF